jgi:toxin ParE1/3/4
MNTFSFSEKAIQDINSICEFYDKTNVNFASKLFDKIRKKCKVYADFPNMGKMDSIFSQNLTREQYLFFSQLRSFRVDNYLIFACNLPLAGTAAVNLVKLEIHA